MAGKTLQELLKKQKNQRASNKGPQLHLTETSAKMLNNLAESEAISLKRRQDRSNSLEALLQKKREEEAKRKDQIEESKNLLEIKISGPEAVEALRDIEGIVLDDSQQQAVNGILQQQYSVLIGPAGCGKTTITKQIIEKLQDKVRTIDLRKTRAGFYNENADKDEFETDEFYKEPQYAVGICICSFTGRAVEQIKKALPTSYHPNCNTIHTTLGYAPVFYEIFDAKSGQMKTTMRFEPSFTESRKLPYRVYIIDESGMCPNHLWNELWAAMPDDAIVIMVGDINQLPPVSGRSVLGFAMTQWPTFELNKIHRNAGTIVKNAHKVLRGEIDLTQDKTFQIIQLPDSSVEAFVQARQIVKLMHKDKIFNEQSDGLIVPQNVGNLGQIHFNEIFAPYFNPEIVDETGNISNPRIPIVTGMATATYAVGDKLMSLENDKSTGLTNGMTGIVTNIALNPRFDNRKSHMSAINTENISLSADALKEAYAKYAMEIGSDKEEEKESISQRQASHIITIKFTTGREVSFQTAGAYNALTHAYAFTCHKSQGGEYPCVVILCHSANSRMLNREWLYTAITRAQSRVYLLANNRGFLQAINRQIILGNTLQEKIVSFQNLQAKADTIVPNLPFPNTLGENW